VSRDFFLNSVVGPKGARKIARVGARLGPGAADSPADFPADSPADSPADFPADGAERVSSVGEFYTARAHERHGVLSGVVEANLKMQVTPC
jgi:hypothetical protein